MKKLLLFILVMVCFTIGTDAQIIHVTPGLLTIQAGIDSAANGDTVLVAEGTYFENINFKGKAITVASQFIMDGDTSHISKTIIDGSQSVNPDTASVVAMWSGEDTTSVLMGFTITGGTGTIHDFIDGKVRGGGGLYISGSGGKIAYNIIEENQVKKTGSQYGHEGGGIFTVVHNNHSLIIRENIIRGNTAKGIYAMGGGISARGGRIICEYNEITDNLADGIQYSFGGGMAGIFFDVLNGVTYFEGVIHEAIVRNNIISGDTSISEWQCYGGGGYAHAQGYGEEFIRVYNNIICNNHTNAGGGGLFLSDNSQGRFFNNTIVDNTAEYDANCAVVLNSKECALYNNIMWGYGSSTKNEFILSNPDAAKLLLFNNILLQPFTNEDPVTAFNNLEAEPVFQSGTYELAEGSPGIGWGRDSFKVDGTWYYAPASDIFGNKRPDPVDPYVDAGAVESAFPRPVYHNAKLASIGILDFKLRPDFHQDTLHYVLPVPDTSVVTPQLDVIPWDWLAEIDINNAQDIGSLDPADRTTTITVTADDGYTQEIYTVQFDYMDTTSTLSNLSISKGTLVPEFNPDILEYTVCLPRLETKTPTVTCETTDPNASFNIVYAKDIQSLYQPFRTTTITVTAEDGIRQTEYEIVHDVDKFIPSITHASDTVILPDSIEVSSNEDGYIYLVPVTTQPNLESIMAHRIDSTIVVEDVIAYIDTAVCGTYWLYVIDNCLNISSAVDVTIIDPTIPSITYVSATVMLPDSIEVTSNEDGSIYLVPVYTSKDLESIMAKTIDSTIVTAGVIAYINTSDTGTYWLYAIDNCLNISSPDWVNIINGISENIAENVRLYPVPVDQILYIETSEAISSVELFNIVGVKVMDKSKPEGPIDMGNLEQGIYFIRIKTDKGEIYTGKVIKK
jgi:hypothetical protein